MLAFGTPGVADASGDTGTPDTEAPGEGELTAAVAGDPEGAGEATLFGDGDTLPGDAELSGELEACGEPDTCGEPDACGELPAWGEPKATGVALTTGDADGAVIGLALGVASVFCAITDVGSAPTITKTATAPPYPCTQKSRRLTYLIFV